LLERERVLKVPKSIDRTDTSVASIGLLPSADTQKNANAETDGKTNLVLEWTVMALSRVGVTIPYERSLTGAANWTTISFGNSRRLTDISDE
jgi:hypothetical protein